MARVALRNWRLKALLQHVFSVIPGGHKVNYAFQRHVTRSYPVSAAQLADDIALAEHHVSMLRRYGKVPIEDAYFFEFGAGWDLAIPLALSRLGAGRQLVIDIRPLARPNLVADAAGRIGLQGADDIVDRASLAGFLTRHRIEYRAPADARDTGIPSESIDYITSTNTLEHIEREDLRRILAECCRVLVPGGVMSLQVDYKDHYSYFDRRRSEYAFLRYSPAQWRRLNPAMHFQNRLRHFEYVDLYRAVGLEVVEEQIVAGSEDDQARVAALPPHASFHRATLEQLAVRESRVVLKASKV